MFAWHAASQVLASKRGAMNHPSLRGFFCRLITGALPTASQLRHSQRDAYSDTRDTLGCGTAADTVRRFSHREGGHHQEIDFVFTGCRLEAVEAARDETVRRIAELIRAARHEGRTVSVPEREVHDAMFGVHTFMRGLVPAVLRSLIEDQDAVAEQVRTVEKQVQLIYVEGLRDMWEAYHANARARGNLPSQRHGGTHNDLGGLAYPGQ